VIKLRDFDNKTNNIINQLKDKIIHTKRGIIKVSLGVVLLFRWPQAEAIKLDNAGAFTLSFKRKVKECIGTWQIEM